MVNRKIVRTPEQIKELWKSRRKKYQKYFSDYAKYYYYKQKLADPNYNKKRKLREKELKKERVK